ncbi:MAG: HemK/PrmC family methyltransferase, partial [Pseudomonadota bacterium]
MSRPNYAELIRDGARTLKSAGIDDPVRDARRLLRFVTGWTATELISAETEPATPAHAAGFAALLAERAARKPLAHLSGEVEFFGLTLRSDARALVPRSDSETVIDLALTHLPETQPLKLADLGTGSGSLLAALLHARPNTQGTAIDASQDALDLAEENFTQLGFRQRVTLFRGSWTDWTGWADCALIVSNPPYIRSDIIPTLDPEVRAH